MVKKVIVAAVVVLVAGGAALWWFVLRDDPPAALSVDGSDGGTSSGSATSTSVGKAPASLDGTWEVVGGDASTAGFRIDESFANGLTDHTAVGRSTDVSGSLTLAGSKVTEADVTVDLTSLTFSDDPGLPVANRANALRRAGLQTDQFPTATFELTEPIDFGERPTEGEVVDATATGELTLHGVTKSVTVPVQAKLAGDTITVATDPDQPVEVSLADHGIEKPVMGPVADVADTGTFELRIVFQKS
ncbi:MAG: YceI family protein [Acidimicrobiales bacterium]